MKFEKSTVFNNVNIKVLSGELVGTTGAAGSGKSSLFQVIIKEVEPTKVRKKIARERGFQETIPLQSTVPDLVTKHRSRCFCIMGGNN
jgi:ABC-type multidrug transport system ATPase subunit